MKKTITKMLIMNMQLFAVNLNATTSEGLSPENKTFYDKVLIREAKAALVHDQFGQKKPIPKNNGKTIEFRKLSSLPKATTPLTEGITPDGSKLTVTNIEATVSQYGDYVAMTDMLELTTIDDMIAETTMLIGQQAGLTLDTVTRNALMLGTNVSYCPKKSNGTETEVTSRAELDTTSKLTVDVVKRVVAKLKGQNAPKFDGSYVAIIHPYVAHDIMNDPLWIDVSKYAAPENMLEGEIGKIGGCRFVETTEAKVYNDSTCPVKTAASDGVDATYHSVFATLFLGRDAYGITDIEGGGLQTIIKQKGSAGSADPLDQRSTIGWKSTKCAELLVPQYIVRVESCSPQFDTTPAN